MALATVKTKTVPDGVTLYLTDDEARTLADILGWVGGNPITTRRGYVDAILDTLKSAGYKFRLRDDLHGRIDFK